MSAAIGDEVRDCFVQQIFGNVPLDEQRIIIHAIEKNPKGAALLVCSRMMELLAIAQLRLRKTIVICDERAAAQEILAHIKERFGKGP